MSRDLLPEAERQFEDLSFFLRHMLYSQDLDPLYPVLRHLQLGMDREQALWLSFLYVAWYNLPSGWAAYNAYPHEIDLLAHFADPTWPTGTERRANRGGKVKDHILSYRLALVGHRSQHDWYTKGLNMNPTRRRHLHDNWRIVNERLQELFLNGRWAAYKHCEVLAKVNGLPLLAPDMGHAFSSGPREGLEMLYGPLAGNDSTTIAELDTRGEDLLYRLQSEGHQVEIEEVETILCNWKSLVKGKYYVGNDIDELQEQILVAEERGILSKHESSFLWRARRKTIPHEYLGELGGWHGPDKQRRKAYKDRGVIVTRRPRRH